MYKVLMLSDSGEEGRWILRQTKHGNGITDCGKYQFFVNEDIPNPDFVVVRGKAIKETKIFNIAPENVVLCTTEPYSVLSYPKSYCGQFGMVCSCQENLKHRNVIFTPAILPWFIGADTSQGGFITKISYDDFITKEIPDKTKLISVITSNKAFTKGHQQRIDFVKKLKAYYGDKLDVFGRGYRDFGDKWDVIAPYKYHIAIENCESKYYWTEKLADTFIGEAYPIYYGCTNVEDYFSSTSFGSINIHDLQGSIETINRIISENRSENSLSSIRDSKKRVLEEYNLFNYIASILDKLDASMPRQEVVIKPSNSMADMHNFYMYTIQRTMFKFNRKVKSLFKKDNIE